MRYYIIAGEPSGDLHASNLIKSIIKRDDAAQIRAMAGDLSREAGAELYRHYKDTAVMGIVEVVKKAGKILNNLSDCKRDILQFNPDVIILVDYPGFNLKIAKFAKSRGIKVFYYIAPKVWAWKEHRVKELRKYVDRLYIIFPFEKDYFTQRGVEAIYLGNPLADLESMDTNESIEEFRQKHHLSNSKFIALFPGSRKMEIEYLMPLYLEFNKILKQSQYSDYKLLIAQVDSIDESLYHNFIDGTDIALIKGDNRALLRHSECAIICSGTASLEAALLGIKHLVCYGFNKISYAIAKLFVKIKYVSLPNIIAGKEVVKELIQGEATPQNIFKEVVRILSDCDYSNRMERSFKEIQDNLNGKGASDRIADSIYNALKG